ncbi:sulfite exporter TauE/SafE family protein [Priestia abyssalis]|uniref:sulfite exporter TauE/SafE family protein n=1 Tax=Priestia abyssalis TaxID=1221450 RepID=UPI0022872E53|nr:sulfite exporter TauE/SafE family protein [Priestia abyssalis]
MTIEQWVLTVASGGIVGFTLGLIGGGGSILAVPLMLYVVGVQDPHIIIGSTAFAVSINAFLNLIPHARAGHVHWKPAIVFAIPGAIGAFFGSTLGKLVPSKQLLFLFSLLMIFMAIKMILPKKTMKKLTASKMQGTDLNG